MEEKMDLRIQKTYLLLHNAFTQLLEEKRFENFTVNELCDLAMIRRATFYKHFADKYEYFSFYMRETVTDFQKNLSQEVLNSGVRGYLLHMSKELLRFMKQHDRLVRNVRESNMFPVLLSILLEQISLDVVQILRAEKSGVMDKRKLEGTAAFYAGGLANTLFQMQKTGTQIDEEEFIGIISDFLPPVKP